MSGAQQSEVKRAVLPAASALLLASALSINAAQEPNFDSLTMPARDPKPVPEAVERGRTSQQSVALTPTRAREKQESAANGAPATTSEKEKISPFAWASLAVSTVAYGFFISQIIRNRETTWLGWVVSFANEALVAATSIALGTASNAVLPVGFAIGSLCAMAVALKFGKREPLTPIEKGSLAISALGWGLYLTNIQSPVLAAWAGQIGYHAANLAFIENFYKNAGKITATGQLLFLGSAALNLMAVTKFWPLTDDLISPVGLGIGIVLSTGALVAGRIKEWRERRQSASS